MLSCILKTIKAKKAFQNTFWKKNPFKCKVCSAAFSESSVLKNPSMSHFGVKPFKCEVCSTSFSFRQNLQRHLLTNSGEKPYKCDICSAVFADKKILKDHQLYQCQFCGAAFSTSYALKIHSKSHSSEKQFNDICAQPHSNIFYP